MAVVATQSFDLDEIESDIAAGGFAVRGGERSGVPFRLGMRPPSAAGRLGTAEPRQIPARGNNFAEGFGDLVMPVASRGHHGRIHSSPYRDGGRVYPFLTAMVPGYGAVPG